MFTLMTRFVQTVVLDGLRERFISKIYFCRSGAFVQHVPYKYFPQSTILKKALVLLSSWVVLSRTDTQQLGH